jgi:hypothetical protein
VITPLGAVLAAVLLAALGFFGGVQVEKSRSGTPAASATGFGRGGFTGAGAATGGAQGGGAGGQQQVDATVGQVSSVDGKTFYVSEQSGDKVRVKTSKSSKITRSAVADADAIHPGDTVIVQGRTASSGTVVATTVVATASNAQSGFGLLRGGFGGGAPQAGATPAGG